MSSLLHECIGDLLRMMESILEIKVILDPACAGTKCPKQRIPLFMKKPKSNKTELCNVDAMIIRNKDIKIIIEIEESDNKPTQICGKYFATNLATFYDYKSSSIDINNASITFIQIIDSKTISGNSSKPDKFLNIEMAIKMLISNAITNNFNHGCIKEYKIIKFDTAKINIYKKVFSEVKNITSSAALINLPKELKELKDLIELIKEGIK